jgi:hypothetical protein
MDIINVSSGSDESCTTEKGGRRRIRTVMVLPEHFFDRTKGSRSGVRRASVELFYLAFILGLRHFKKQIESGSAGLNNDSRMTACRPSERMAITRFLSLI